MQPADCNMWNQLGLSYITMESDGMFSKREKAPSELLSLGISAFCNALRVNPFLTAALTNLGRTLLELGSQEPNDRHQINMSGKLVLLWSLSVQQVVPQDEKPVSLARQLLGGSQQLDSDKVAVNVLKAMYDVGTANLQSYIVDRLMNETNQLEIALLISLLYLAWDETLPESYVPLLVPILLQTLSKRSFERFEYLPQRCLIIIQMQVVVILSLLGMQFSARFAGAMKEHGGYELVAQRLIIQGNSHPIITQFSLGLLNLLPPSSGNSESGDPRLWAQATRLIENPSARVSLTAIDFLRAHLEIKTQTQVLEVFLAENGLKAVNRVVQHISETNLERIYKTVLLLAAITTNFKENTSLQDAIRNSPLLTTIKALLSICDEVKEIAVPLRQTLQNLGVDIATLQQQQQQK